MEEEKRKKENRKALLLMILGVLVLGGVIIGATYAYFQAQAGDGAKADIDATTGTTDNLTFKIEPVEDDEDPNIIINATQENFSKGKGNLYDEVNAKATLTANNTTNSATMYYNVYLNITGNDFEYTQNPETPELFLTIKGPENFNSEISGLKKATLQEENDSYDITKTSGLIKIAENFPITVSGNEAPASTTDTWNIKITFKNLEENQNGNSEKTFNAQVIIQSDKMYTNLAEACIGKEAGSCMIENYNLDSTLYYHNADLTGGAQDDSYRYAGTSDAVKNYVCLDGGATSEGKCGETDADLYRIIGLFKNSEDLYEMKLIKYDYATSDQLGDTGAYSAAYSYTTSNYKGNQENLASIGGYYWTSSSNQVNEWAGSALRETNLNDYYLNTYLKEEKGIDIDNLITTHTWSLNGHSSYSVNPKVMYDNEMDKVEDSSPSYPTQTKEVPDKIGLMYASDYGYAASPSSTSNWTKNVSSYNNNSIPNNNWMYMGLTEWTISRASCFSYSAFRVYDTGYVLHSSVSYDARGVRPSFYLTSDVKIKSGDGGKDSPYRLSLQ